MNTVALYLDFENLALSAEQVYPSKSRPLAIQPIVDYATKKGHITLKKAYADWSNRMFSKYQDVLMEQGFELVHAPSINIYGKNGSDVRMAIDVMEHMEFFPQTQTVIIGSGDTDFIPLIQRVKSRGKEVLVIGFEHSVGRLVKGNSNEFRSLEELIGLPEDEAIVNAEPAPSDLSYGRNLLLRYLKLGDIDDVVKMAQLKIDLLKLDPTFSEKKLGFETFKKFVKSFEGDLVERVFNDPEDNLPLVHFRANHELEVPEEEAEDSLYDENYHLYIEDVWTMQEAKDFLYKKMKYSTKPERRERIVGTLYALMLENAEEGLSMSQMGELVHERLLDSSKVEVKKYVNTLFTGGAFRYLEQDYEGSLLARPLLLKENITGHDVLMSYFQNRVQEILKNKFPSLDYKEIGEMMNL